MANCCVYIIGWQPEGPVKFGIANSPPHRLETLQGGCPYRLRIFKAWIIGGAGRASTIERDCLNARGSGAMVGEWASFGSEEAFGVVEKAIKTRGFVAKVWEPRRDRARIPQTTDREDAAVHEHSFWRYR
jgi:hypothetical protein